MDQKELLDKIGAAESAEEIESIAKEAGVELTAEQIDQILAAKNAPAGGSSEPEALDEEALGQVTGGIAITDMILGFIKGNR